MKYLNDRLSMILIYSTSVILIMFAILLSLKVKSFEKAILINSNDSYVIKTNELIEKETYEILINDNQYNLKLLFRKTSVNECIEYCYFANIDNIVSEKFILDRNINNALIIVEKISYLEMIWKSIF